MSVKEDGPKMSGREQTLQPGIRGANIQAQSQPKRSEQEKEKTRNKEKNLVKPKVSFESVGLMKKALKVEKKKENEKVVVN